MLIQSGLVDDSDRVEHEQRENLEKQQNKYKIDINTK